MAFQQSFCRRFCCVPLHLPTQPHLPFPIFPNFKSPSTLGPRSTSQAAGPQTASKYQLCRPEVYITVPPKATPHGSLLGPWTSANPRCFSPQNYILRSEDLSIEASLSKTVQSNFRPLECASSASVFSLSILKRCRLFRSAGGLQEVVEVVMMMRDSAPAAPSRPRRVAAATTRSTVACRRPRRIVSRYDHQLEFVI